MGVATASFVAVFVAYSLVLLAAGSISSPAVDRQSSSCYSTNQRCSGAPGRPLIPWKPCCDPDDSCSAASDWGSVCKKRSSSGSSTGSGSGSGDSKCHAPGVKCRGAPGYPYVQWKPCCRDTDQCLPVTDKQDWGYVCRGGTTDSGGGGSNPTTASPPSGGNDKCHNTNEKCEGAPGRPYVQWKPCCKDGDGCLPVTNPSDWGKVCRPYSNTDSGFCHKTGVKCQGAPGYPLVQWKPCCSASDRCVPVADPSDWGYECRSSSVTQPPTDGPSSTSTTRATGSTTTTSRTNPSSSSSTTRTDPSSSTSTTRTNPSSSSSSTTGTNPSSSSSTTRTNPSSSSTSTSTSTTSTTRSSTTTTRSTTSTSASGVCGRGRSTRRDVRTLSTAEWDRYAAAVNTLNQRQPNTAQTIYEGFVQAHVDNAVQGHLGAYFLPWHRQMIFEFEQALKGIDSSVSIPYWDWSTVNADFKRDSRLWNRYGGAQDGQPIPNPPFRNWNTRVPNQHNILRGFNTGDDHSSDVWFVDRANLDVLISNTGQSFATFAEYLEGVHNTPHVAIGQDVGDMNNFFSSPNDPVFYSHHAFIDKTWREWQTNGAGNRFGGVHRGAQATLDQPMMPWGRTVRQILEGISDCVTYAESSERPPRATPVTAARMVVQPSLLNSSLLRQVVQEAASTPVPVKLDTYGDKREAQKEVAQTKIEKPEEYRQKCLAANDVMNAMDAACVKAGFPRDMIDRVRKSYEALKLLTGVNVKDAPIVAQASAEDIKQEGEQQARSLQSGRAPARTDDSDVAQAA